MKMITCQECNLTWDMTRDITPKTYCPYCGVIQVEESPSFTRAKTDMQRELNTYKINNAHWSCTDDYSYWWGVVSTLDKNKLITSDEERELKKLVNEFKQYSKR